ncbi:MULTISPECIES: hypothetical protein [Streptomyces]|uniref:hypothetical protein n=1 Tax=Streptomyces TaxID=1883 RepID=UPI0035E1F331
MDQEWATVLTAGIGLVGALGGSLLGARAAIKGARDAAVLAADAARQQLADQAEMEHRHWLRQERQKSYREVLDAYAVLTPVIWEVHESLHGGRMLEASELADLSVRFDELISPCMRLNLIGPARVTASGEDLRRALRDVFAIFQRFEASGPPEEELAPLLSELRAAVEIIRSRYLEFMAASQQVLLSGAD